MFAKTILSSDRSSSSLVLAWSGNSFKARQSRCVRLVSVHKNCFSAFDVLEHSQRRKFDIFPKNILNSQVRTNIHFRMDKIAALSPVAFPGLVIFTNRSQILLVQAGFLLQLMLAVRKTASACLLLVFARDAL